MVLILRIRGKPSKIKLIYLKTSLLRGAKIQRKRYMLFECVDNVTFDLKN